MSRKPVSPESEKAVNEVMRKFCEDVERRPEEAKALTGVLAQLDEQPREA